MRQSLKPLEKGIQPLKKGLQKNGKGRQHGIEEGKAVSPLKKGSCKWRESCLPSKQGEELQPQAHKQKEL